MILVGELSKLNQHPRHILSIRSNSSTNSKHHSIVLYSSTHERAKSKKSDADIDDKRNEGLRLEKKAESLSLEGDEEEDESLEWNAMEEECPHLGASMVDATIEIEDDQMIAICPWHNYDFNLKTGESSTGIQACVFKTIVKDSKLFIDYPDGVKDWELISIRPVSQRFAIKDLTEREIESSIAQNRALGLGRPRSLIEFGGLILRTSDPDQKVNLTRHAVNRFRSGKLPISAIIRSDDQQNDEDDDGAESFLSIAPDRPTREESIKVVKPNQVAKRGKSGNLNNRIKVLHALANIELWAIDLAWDIIVRFGSKTRINGRSLPRAFFNDFCKVAEDEAKHFTLLREALIRLGSDWGELPIHDGLWQSAIDTSHSLISRLCIIHLVHEARGLDVNPIQIKRVREAGDNETASTLEIIHADEVTHVAAGHRWLCFICEESEPKLDPVKVFRDQVKEHFIGRLKPPFNVEDRARAGLNLNFYEDL